MIRIRGTREGAWVLAAANDMAEGFRLALRYGAPLLLTAALPIPALAHAQTVSGGTSPTTILNNIATFILGPFGQSIAVLSVIGIGVAFMFGRATLGLFFIGSASHGCLGKRNSFTSDGDRAGLPTSLISTPSLRSALVSPAGKVRLTGSSRG